MKKVLFFFALLGGMMAAQAQNDFQLVNNNVAYNNGDTINVEIYEEDIYEMDYQVLVFLKVNNLSTSSVTMTLTTHILSGNEAFRVQSVCSTVCAEGETCPPFTVGPNGQSDNVFPEYVVTPEAAPQGAVGVAELILKNTANNAEILKAYAKLNYHPMNQGIAEHKEVKVKVYPNPTASMLNINAEDIDEIVLTDMSGKTVLRQMVNGDAQINVETLQNGMYILNTIKDGQVNGTQKVMVR